MIFGLACEGITDQIVLKNILCGYFDDHDLDDEIIELQPSLDETEQKQQGFGGWEALLFYLKRSQFHDHVLSHEYIIVQLDSDITEHQNFNVSHSDTNNKPLEVEELINNITQKLISAIDENNNGFYKEHASKIIFAICVHSLECWLYACYNPHSPKKTKITGCCKALEYTLKTKGFCKPKNVRLYEKYSEIFLKQKNINVAIQKDASFNYFIQSLGKIEL